MKSRIAAFIALIVFAGLSLGVVGFWSKNLAGSTDTARIERAEYFVQTWMIAFIIAAVAAVFVLINMIVYKRRQYDHDTE